MNDDDSWFHRPRRNGPGTVTAQGWGACQGPGYTYGIDFYPGYATEMGTTYTSGTAQGAGVAAWYSISQIRLRIERNLL